MEVFPPTDELIKSEFGITGHNVFLLEVSVSDSQGGLRSKEPFKESGN